MMEIHEQRRWRVQSQLPGLFLRMHFLANVSCDRYKTTPGTWPARVVPSRGVGSSGDHREQDNIQRNPSNPTQADVERQRAGAATSKQEQAGSNHKAAARSPYQCQSTKAECSDQSNKHQSHARSDKCRWRGIRQHLLFSDQGQ